MIKNIVFDIGDTLMRFTWNQYIHELFGGDKKTIDAVNEAINGTNLWIELDRGVIPEEEVLYRMRNYNNARYQDVVKALKNVKLCFNKVDYAVPWVKELKAAGYSVYYLSNYSQFNLKAAPEVLDFLPFMDGGIFSCDVKHIKPDPAIYKSLCSTYHLHPSECIFIDDRQENVDAAIKFGMNAILFEDYQTTKAKLNEILA